MPPSQLKRLKASLLAAGVVGPQKSKKDKKKAAQNGTTAQGRVEKSVKLQSIREEFNPFELKTTRVKHDVSGRKQVKGAQGRPGLSKQVGEEHRKKTLLVEMQKRNKAGGIIDRRFGENDPTMAPEERMLERFTREKQSRLRNGDIFNLEDDDATLTHFGQSLGGGLDDYDEGEMINDDDDDEESGFLKQKKRGLGEDEDDSGASGDERPARKKTKAEVMKEVIAKSKQHKWERQKAKDEDEDIREELDAQMGDIWALLTGPKNPPPKPLTPLAPLPQLDAGRAALIAGGDVDGQQNKEYDAAVREMIFDKRSKPADRTKTAEEKAVEEAERLKKLEENRQRRMRGEAVSDDENERRDRKGKKAEEPAEEDDDDKSELGDAHEYGFGSGIPITDPRNQPNPDEIVDGDYEEENNWDEESASGAEHSDDYDSDSDVSAVYPRSDDDDFDAEFLADVLPAKNDRKKPQPTKSSFIVDDTPQDGKVAYTYPCPETHKDFLVILKNIPVEELPTVIQRIRILYNPKLAEGNKAKLANFSAVLLDHIMYVARTVSPIPFAPLETAMRHLHALAKSHPLRISEAFRVRLSELSKKPSEEVNPGDLMMLTAVTTIYPTSDMFHPVVTPASLAMAKYLAQTPPDSLKNLAVGTFITTLLVQSQRLSKRIIPEAINYILLSLSNLSPQPIKPLPGTFPDHNLTTDALRIKESSSTKNWIPRKPTFSDILSPAQDTPLALLNTHLSLLTTLSNLYAGKSAFPELFQPAVDILTCLTTSTTTTNSTSPLPLATHTHITTTILPHLTAQIAHSIYTRRPLELHHHRPLPIPSNIPKFHETYSLDKRSYDPDKQRAETAKLKAEVKKERKGAMRELRKDASFVAREKLREEKAASKEYHAKMKRLTEMIQHEEGQGKNEYERERRARGKGRK